MRGVDDQQIDMRGDQRFGTLDRSRPTPCGADPQPPERVLARVRYLIIFWMSLTVISP